MPLVTFLIMILIAIVIAGALYALIGEAAIGEPFKRMARIVILAFFVIVMLVLLLDVLGAVRVGIFPLR